MISKRYFRMVIFATMFAGTFLGVGTVRADSAIVWSDPEPIGQDLPSSWFPEIYADMSGNVHLVWEATRNLADPDVNDSNGGAIMYAQRRGGQWGQPMDIFVKDIGNAARPIIVTDGQYAHVIARALRPTGVLAGIDYTRAPLSENLADARSWSDPVALTGPITYWASLIALPNDDLVVVYNEHVPIEKQGALDQIPVLFSRFSRDHGETWSDPVRISGTDGLVARSSLSFTPDGSTIIVAWDDGYSSLTGQGEPNGIFTAVSADGGISWSKPSRIGDDESDIYRRQSYAERGTVEQSTVVTNGTQTLLVYRSTVSDALFYRTSEDLGQTWSGENQIPYALMRPYGGPHHFDKLALSVDSSGRFILAYVGQDSDAPNGLSVMSMTFDSESSWSEPEVVASPIGFPEYPRLAVSLGNQIHLTYFVRDTEFSDEQHYGMWTVAGVSDAPAIEPVPITASRQEPSATPAPETGSDIFAYPNLQQAPITSGSAIESQNDPQSTFTQPIVLMVGITTGALLLLLFIRFVWRSVTTR